MIGVGGSTTIDRPITGLPAVGHIGFHYPDGADHWHSRHPEPVGFAASTWWAPPIMLRIQDDGVTEWANGAAAAASAASLRAGLFRPAPAALLVQPGVWTQRTSRSFHIRQVERILKHIQRGNIYEVNYCTARTAVIKDWDVYAAFARLLAHTDAPFAGFYRQGDHYALCMSPERYLRVEGPVVTTQPMKGTRRRDPDPSVDAALRLELEGDPKERSENIMAVDVARNDLSRIAAPASVVVPECCVVHTYPTVHQLVSTVRAELREDAEPWDAVRATFPMASMTGAPKLRALRIIDEMEEQQRGLFSGSLGYQLPDGTLDLNVVIRTITYDALSGIATLITGGAITANSDPEKEWEECEVKARSVLNALGHAG